MKTMKILKNIYVSSFIASFLSFITLIQLNAAKSDLLNIRILQDTFISPQFINYLSPIASIILALTIIFYAQRKKTEAIDMIQALIKISVIFSALIVVFVFEGSIITSKQSFVLCFKVFAYLIFSFIEVMLPVMVWGVINSVYSKDREKITYILLSVGITLIVSLLSTLVFSYYPKILDLAYFSSTAPLLISIVSMVLLLLFIIKWWEIAGKHSAEADKLIKPNKFPWLKSTLLLVSASASVFSLFNYFLMSQKFAHPSLESLTNTDINSTALIILNLIVVVLVFGFGIYALRKKSWGFAVQGGAVILLAGSLLCVILAYIFPAINTYVTDSIRTTFGCVQTMLMFPLMQLLYLCLPIKDRFSMKLKVEIVCVQALNLAISSLAPAVYMLAANQNFTLYSLLVIGFAILIAALLTSKRLGMELKNQLS